MNIDLIKKTLDKIKSDDFQLKTINENYEDIKFELRIFTENGWSKISYIPKTIAIRNMVIHQLRIDLENEIKTSKELLKKIINQ